MTVSRPGWSRVLLGATGGPAWRGLGYLLLGVPAGIAAFLLWFASVCLGLLLSLLVVGVPVTLCCLAAIRFGARAERRRAAMVLRAPVPEPYRPVSGGILARLRGRLGDPATWRDLLWLVGLLPLALPMTIVSVTLLAMGLTLSLLPLWYRIPPTGGVLFDFGPWGRLIVDSVPLALPFSLAGLLILWSAGWAVRGLAFGQARLARALLGPSHATELGRRVETLAATRSAAADTQARDLRRIERDLHDGAQARLVAMGADLGLAAEVFEDDPRTARALLDEARVNAEQALAELRSLVRGIAPPILADRGLAGALEALAVRSAVPVRLTVDVDERAATAAETAVYFVVAEALTNVARHAAARTATVDLRRRGDRLVVRVSDDGSGGADLSAGTGLQGLRDRLSALDGTLSIESPSGGPTLLIAEVPCGS